jgi:AbrB family looped-hinge helix DNA binding protein
MRKRARLTVQTVTITSKGQLTVPAALRRRLRLRRGDKLAGRALDGESFSMVLCRTRPATRSP